MYGSGVGLGGSGVELGGTAVAVGGAGAETRVGVGRAVAGSVGTAETLPGSAVAAGTAGELHPASRRIAARTR
jgi:hypothetical protein